MFPCLTAPCLHAAHVTPLQRRRRARQKMLHERPGEEEQREETEEDERRERSRRGDSAMKTQRQTWAGR